MIKGKKVSKKIILLIILFINVLLYLIFKSKQVGLNLPTFHLDGAFQTSSALFRVNSGNIFGRDYLPYLGIGVIYMLYPLYKILGSTLFASVVSANFAVLLCGFFVYIIIFYLLIKNKKLFMWYGSLIFFIFNSELSVDLIFYKSSGNSLKPIRSFLPYIVFFVYYICMKKIKNNNIKIFIISLLIVISLFWSNDYAYITLFMLGIKILIDFRKNKKNLIFIAIISILLFIISLIIFRIDILEYWKYNFLDVSKDQWWYFEPLDRSEKFLNFFDIITVIRVGNLILPIILICYHFIFYFKTKNEMFIINNFIGISLLLGGIVAVVGGHIISEYFDALHFWTNLNIIALLINSIDRFLINKKIKFRFLIYRILIVITLIFSFSMMYSEKENYQVLKHSLKIDNTKIFVPELGGYLTNEWKNYLDYIDKNKNAKIVEEYAGIWTSYVRPKHYVWRVDSAIHALGKIREESAEKIKTADIVITTRQDYNAWQKWSFSQNFWFYSELFKNFKIDYIAPTVVVWKRQKMKNPEEELKNCVIDPSGFLINENKEGYYEVELNYKVKRNSRGLIVMLDNNIWDNDIFSISPYSNNAKIPIYLRTPNEKFNFNLIGGIKSIKIETCNYRKLEKHEYTNM